MGNKHYPINLYLETSSHDIWFEDEKSADTTKRNEEELRDLSSMPPLEGDEEEVKEEEWIKILTPNKLITRFPVLLAQIKATNNSYKLKNEIR